MYNLIQNIFLNDLSKTVPVLGKLNNLSFISSKLTLLNYSTQDYLMILFQSKSIKKGYKPSQISLFSKLIFNELVMSKK